MRRATAIFLGSLFSICMVTATVEAADKLGYVDLSKLFAEYGKTKEYDKVLSEKQKVYNTEREKRVSEIKAFQDKMNLLSDKEKEAKKAEFESKVKDFQEFERQKETDLRKDEDEKMKEILKDIEEAVKQHASKEGYTLVFNDRVLVYQTKSLDITDYVLTILNSKAGAKTPAKATKK